MEKRGEFEDACKDRGSQCNCISAPVGLDMHELNLDLVCTSVVPFISEDISQNLPFLSIPPPVFPINNYILCIKLYYAIVLNIINGNMELLIPIS